MLWNACIGQRVQIKWDGPDEWYLAEVLRFDAARESYVVRYEEDGTETAGGGAASSGGASIASRAALATPAFDALVRLRRSAPA